MARAVNEKLRMYDFNTFFDEDDLIAGDIYVEVIRDNISKAAEEGYVLAFLNEVFRKESWQYRELMTAMRYQGRIIPVVTAPLSDEAEFLFRNINWIDVQNMSISEASDRIVDCLMKLDIQNNK